MMKKSNSVPKTILKGTAKVPVILQMEALECGAAALAMVLAYYKKWVPLEQVRRDCGVSRDGSNAKNIYLAAQNYGLKVNAFKYEPQTLKEKGKFPCIVHWNFNHFVVVNGFKGDKVIINDPARGTVKVAFDEFDKAFTGICILFEPSEDFKMSGKQKSVISFAKKRLKGTTVAFLFVVTTTIITSLIGVINPGFSRVFIDRLLNGQNADWMIPFFIGLGVITFVQLISAWINAVYLLKIQGKMAIVANTTFLWHVIRMPMEFFSQRMAGDIASRQSSNEGIANTLISTFAPLVLNFFMMIFYLTVMIRYSLVLTAVGVLSMLVNLVSARIISNKRIGITRLQMRNSGKLAGSTVAGCEMIETIKSSGAENGFFSKWAGYHAASNAQRVNYEKLNRYLGTLPSFISTVANNAILMIGVYLVMNGEFTIGMISAFSGFMGSFSAPASSLISAGQTLQEMRTSMERIEDVMAYPPDVDYNANILHGDDAYQKLSGKIEMKNVTFGYSRLGEPLIENFNMTLESGKSVAFVGASGCGKSTLSKLISGLYKPWSGEILFDGKPISEINRGIFTSSVAVVDQDIILFEDTIANNIKMWDDSIEDFEMILASRDTQLHNDIMQRNGGYNYKVLEGGKDFSGGQRQRMEIARALAQDPSIIILDEATSALDAKTEYSTIKAINRRAVSCVVIAHRLSTIRDCDEIIVMKNGKVVERGKHDELYTNGGYYTDLITNE
jgi:NHLM bacteriocin system ABC transporter peptidase/ATP-binding protein